MHRIFRILYISILFAAALLGSASCDHSPEKKTTIAVVPKVDDKSVAAAKAAALAARDTYNIRVRWDVSNVPTAESQSLLIEKLVAAGVDGILISCVDAEGVREAIGNAIAAGVTVGTFDSDSPLSGRSFYIGSDNAAAGLLAASTLQALCSEAGRPATGIGLFGGVRGDTAMQLRLEGFLTAVPDTAALLWSGDNTSTGTTQVTDFLTKNAQLPVDGVVFLSSTAVIDGPANISRLDSLCSAGGAGRLFRHFGSVAGVCGEDAALRGGAAGFYGNGERGDRPAAESDSRGGVRRACHIHAGRGRQVADGHVKWICFRSLRR